MFKKFIEITPKCFKAITLENKELLIPSSQVYDIDDEGYENLVFVWMSRWIINQKKLWVSKKKYKLFYKDSKNEAAKIIRIKHIPKSITNLKQEPDNELIR